MKNLVTEYSKEVLSLVSYFTYKYTKEGMDRVKPFSEEKLKLILTLIPEESFLKIWEHVENTEETSYRKLMFHLRDKGLLQFEPTLIMHPEKGPTLIVDYSCWMQFDGIEFVVGKLLDTPIKLTHSVKLTPSVETTLLKIFSSTKYSIEEKSTMVVQHLLADGGRTYLRQLIKLNSPVLYDWINSICKYWGVEMTGLNFNSAFYPVEIFEKSVDFIEKKEIIIGSVGLNHNPESIGIIGWTTEGIFFQTVDGKNLKINKNDIIKDSAFLAMYKMYNTFTLWGVGILQKGIIRLESHPRKEVSTQVVETSIVSAPTFKRYMERIIESLNRVETLDVTAPSILDIEDSSNSFNSNSFSKKRGN